MKKRYSYIAALAVVIAVCTALGGCKTKLEPGGAYAPVDPAGNVLGTDTGLALADASYKLAYDTMFAVFKYERDNRAELFALSPRVKHGLDALRPQVVAVDRRWAIARSTYRVNPTPAGLGTLQTILAEIQRLLPVVQAELAPLGAAVVLPTVPQPATP